MRKKLTLLKSIVHSSSAIKYATTAIMFTALTEAANASNAFAPMNKAVQTIIDFVTGPFGTSLAIIAFFALGFMAWFGRLSWTMALTVILGIGLVFGAPQFVPELISAVGK